MTINDNNLFHPGSAPRRINAASVDKMLRHDQIPGVHYDGDVTVTAGPVTAVFDDYAATVTFVDRWCGQPERCTVTMLPDCPTFGAVTDIVAALVAHLAVTP
jgi:hypothetical protein